MKLLIILLFLSPAAFGQRAPVSHKDSLRFPPKVAFPVQLPDSINVRKAKKEKEDKAKGLAKRDILSTLDISHMQYDYWLKLYTAEHPNDADTLDFPRNVINANY